MFIDMAGSLSQNGEVAVGQAPISLTTCTVGERFPHVL